MNKVFNNFKVLLSERLSKNILTTEDSIRYTFFHSLIIKGRYKPENIVLEQPYEHPKFRNDKLDLYVISRDRKQSLSFELKYHRGDSIGHAGKPGELFWDIAKLTNTNTKDKYLIYIADNKMKNYFTNPKKKNLREFFALTKGSKLQITPKYFKDPKEFPKSSRTWLKDKGYNYIRNFRCTVKSVFISNLPQQHYLRIYKIEK